MTDDRTNETGLSAAFRELLELLEPEQRKAVIRCAAHGAAFVETLKLRQPIQRIGIPDMRRR